MIRQVNGKGVILRAIGKKRVMAASSCANSVATVRFTYRSILLPACDVQFLFAKQKRMNLLIVLSLYALFHV